MPRPSQRGTGFDRPLVLAIYVAAAALAAATLYASQHPPFYGALLGVIDPIKNGLAGGIAAGVTAVGIYLKVGHNSRASICAVGANNYEIEVPEFEFSKLGWGIRVFETRRNL